MFNSDKSSYPDKFSQFYIFLDYFKIIVTINIIIILILLRSRKKKKKKKKKIKKTASNLCRKILLRDGDIKPLSDVSQSQLSSELFFNTYAGYGSLDNYNTHLPK